MTAAAKPPRAKLRESRQTIAATAVLALLVAAPFVVAAMVAPR